MSEFQYPVIDEVIYTLADGNIVRKRKSVGLPAFVTLAGIALAVCSLRSEALADKPNVASALMLLGALVALFGVVRLIVLSRGCVPVYKPTGERLRRSELFYDAKDKQKLCRAVEDRDADALKRVPRGESSGVVVTVYATPNGGFTAMQVSEYVPHQFVPVTDVVVSEESGRSSEE